MTHHAFNHLLVQPHEMVRALVFEGIGRGHSRAACSFTFSTVNRNGASLKRTRRRDVAIIRLHTGASTPSATRSADAVASVIFGCSAATQSAVWTGGSPSRLTRIALHDQLNRHDPNLPRARLLGSTRSALCSVRLTFIVRGCGRVSRVRIRRCCRKHLEDRRAGPLPARQGRRRSRTDTANRRQRRDGAAHGPRGPGNVRWAAHPAAAGVTPSGVTYSFVRKWLLSRPQSVRATAEDRRGALVTLLGRWVPAPRQPNPVGAGVSRSGGMNAHDRLRRRRKGDGHG